MNKFRNILVFLLVLISTSAFSQPATIVGSALGEPGDTVSIPIAYLGTGSGVVGFQADINFDNSNLSVAINCNSTLGSAGIGCTDLGSFVRIVVFGIPLNELPNGQIGTLDFTISSGVTTPDTFPLTVTNEVYSDINSISVNPIGTTDGLISVDDLYSVGGDISGLISNVTLQNNVGDDLVITANGTFTFPTDLINSSSYMVSVASQPTAPNQVCLVTGGINGDGTGIISGADEASVQVTCHQFFSVGGNVSGLTSSVTLQNDAGDDLTINTNGLFIFPTAILDTSSYLVSVVLQPTSPDQICVVSGGINGDGTGIIAGADETSIQVICSNFYSIGGNVSGLISSVTLQNNAGDDLVITADGGFTFPTELLDNSSYAVTVVSQPTSPNQVCVVSGGINGDGTGIITEADETNIQIACSSFYNVGGNVSGLVSSVTLQNNAGDDLVITANGGFTFPTELLDNGSYVVTVASQPTSPNQVCAVTGGINGNGSGTIVGVNETSIQVTCSSFYSVGGSVSGLTSSVTLQNNAGDDFVITTDGGFTFPTELLDNSSYVVTVASQPTSPDQICLVTGGINGDGTGIIVTANEINIQVTCSSQLYSVGGDVSGLVSSVTLQNNSGDDLIINANGSFVFPTGLLNTSNYSVSVFLQPISPDQICLVTGGTNGDGTGTIAVADEISIQVMCSSQLYSVGGNVSGLASSVTLQNNLADDLIINANGSFVFSTGLLNTSSYAVSVASQPISPSQTCLVTGGTNGDGTGIIVASDDLTIQVTCNTSPIVNNNSYIKLEDEVLLAVDVDGTIDNNPNNDGVLANDIDGDILSIVAPGTYDPIAGIGGVLTINADGAFLYNSPVNAFGVATFSFEVTDGISIVASELSITIQPVNDMPTFDILGDVEMAPLVFPPNPVIQIPNFTHNIDLGEFEDFQTIQQFNLSIISDTNNVLNTATMDNTGNLDMDLTFNEGIAILQLSLQDDGGVANDGIDTSDTIEFNVSYLESIYEDGFEDVILFKFINSHKGLTIENERVNFEGHYIELYNFNNDLISINKLKAWIREIEVYQSE